MCERERARENGSESVRERARERVVVCVREREIPNPSEFRVPGVGFLPKPPGIRGSVSESNFGKLCPAIPKLRVSGSGFRVPGFGFRVSGSTARPANDLHGRDDCLNPTV